MGGYFKLAMKSLLLLAAGLASCLLFASCGKDTTNPFKMGSSNEPQGGEARALADAGR